MLRVRPLISEVRRYTSSTDKGRLSQLPKAYNPIDFESRILQKWSGRKRLTSLEGGEGPTFRMVFPPPNVTGKLHLGHALTVAIQDTIVRLKLMRGHKVDWIPGFDHAGIATHSVVTRKLAKSRGDGNTSSGQLRLELQNHSSMSRESIRNQLNMMGALLDWDKEYYTLDENHSLVVKEAFMHLFENDVIRRGEGMINWCFALKSSVADIEVEQIEFKGRKSFGVPGHHRGVDFGLLYHVAYPVQNSNSRLIVATSRPETMFGDVAIAVHPSDPNNTQMIGQSVLNPINGKIIPVIPDSRVKLNFGTGVLKITPAHDKLDFAIGTDHQLPAIKIFNFDGNMNENCGAYLGNPRFVAREKVISQLRDSGALVDIKEYSGTVGICSRTQDIIEPMLYPHWFFKTESLSEIIRNCVKAGDLVIKPENMQDVLLHQLSNAHDWCLSRQISWGHEIPAYFHLDYPEEWVTASSKLTAIKKLESKLGIKVTDENKVSQDPDVLDTWFSSALVPLSLSNWPDVDNFQEISLMETGNDILLFWVWRMLMMNLALVDKLPFKSVLLHGVVVDNYGRKMSKSKGNVLDPMHVIEGRDLKTLIAEAEASLVSGEITSNEFTLRKHALEKDYPGGMPACGADGIRFALLSQDIYHANVTICLDYLENCKHFCNKLWQAMRLYLHYSERCSSNMYSSEILSASEYSGLPVMDKWILAALHDFVHNYETSIRNCRFHLATDAIRTFFYGQYCDIYLEFAKLELKKDTNVNQHLRVMNYVLCTTLKMAHPFLPFVTEEIWSVLNEGTAELLIDTKQPLTKDLVIFQSEEISEYVEKMLKLLKHVRAFKINYFPGFKGEPNVYVEVHANDTDLMNAQLQIEALSKVKLNFDVLGRNSVSNSLGVMFDLNGGRSCRISCLRSDPALVIPNVGEAKLIKLQTRLAKLKEQYENPSFQEKASQVSKEKLLKKLQLLQSRIDEATTAEASPKQPTDSNS